MSKAHDQTDEILEKLERRIKRLYAKETKEVREKVAAYFKQFEAQEKEQRAKLKAGEITEQQFVNWRLQHITRTREFLALRDEVAEKVTDAAEKALEATAEVLPEIYAINHNEESADVDEISPLTAAAVAALALATPALLNAPKLKRQKELAFNKRNFTAHVTGMIMVDHRPTLYGNPPLVKVVDFTTKRSRDGVVINARTAVTYAENRGRQAVYDAMAALGMKVKKQWFTQGDNLVRHAHAMMHGKKVPGDKPFVIEGYDLMFPGDGRNAPPRLYINCRCYMHRERSKK